MQAEAPAHVVPDSAGGLRWRRVKIHWRSEVQSEYKQILFAFRTGQVLGATGHPGPGNKRCMTSAASSNPDSKSPDLDAAGIRRLSTAIQRRRLSAAGRA